MEISKDTIVLAYEALRQIPANNSQQSAVLSQALRELEIAAQEWEEKEKVMAEELQEVKAMEKRRRVK